MNGQEQQIYPVPTQVLAFTQEEVTDILLLIESIRPEEIVSPEQLIWVGVYNFAQIRIAIAQQAMQYKGRSVKKKRVSQDIEAYLSIYFPLSRQGDLPKRVKLDVSTSRSFILEFEFPILEPQNSWDAVQIRFSDFRQRPHRLTFLSDMQKGAALQDIQHMWSGLRFLCRNLREWEQEGITWPEDI